MYILIPYHENTTIFPGNKKIQIKIFELLEDKLFDLNE